MRYLRWAFFVAFVFPIPNEFWAMRILDGICMFFLGLYWYKARGRREAAKEPK